MMLSCIGPETTSEWLPIQEHPYKMFALAQVTFLFWRTVQLLSIQEGDEWQKAKAALFIVPNIQNLGSLFLSDLNGFHSQRLSDVVKAAFVLHYVNFLDALFPDKLNSLGEDALNVRVAMLGVTALLLFSLIYHANGDRPFRAKIKRV